MADGDLAGVAIRDKVRSLTHHKPKTQRHIRVIAELCNGCALCLKFCPSGSWKLRDGVAVWEYGMECCLECGTCFCVCPRSAIAWSYPRGGEGVLYSLG
ncbi:MAG: 4Fe-4S dicluster domain-containing protein [Candidatus Bathyarchaeia archaeon]